MIIDGLLDKEEIHWTIENGENTDLYAFQEIEGGNGLQKGE